MQTSIGKRFAFEASHILPWHPGKCARLHGHSYKLEVTITGTLSANGIITDFDRLSEVVNREVVEKLDHRHLNDLLPNPTAELIAAHIFRVLSEAWNVSAPDGRAPTSWISSVRLYETEKCFAEVSV